MSRTAPVAIPAEASRSAAPIAGEPMTLTNGDDDPIVIPVSIGGTDARAIAC
ncbi:hypothetical protein [Sphingomonas sp.]|uniref:hypothetical protein n=1 Tax=Sphingomonas sp. TaxID=28214 RepID=UPI002ED93A0A